MDDGDRTLIAGATTPMADAARRLRIRLETTGHRTLLVAAVDDGDAAAVATLVAQSLAQGERHATLIDADLRHPVIAERLGLAPQAGLAAVLRGEAELTDTLVTTDDELHVLAAEAGAGSPLELVDSGAMTRTIRDLAVDRHYVLVVGPSVKAFPDSPALARRVDAVLLVVRAGRTQQRDLKLALADLDPRTAVFLVVTDA